MSHIVRYSRYNRDELFTQAIIRIKEFVITVIDITKFFFIQKPVGYGEDLRDTWAKQLLKKYFCFVKLSKLHLAFTR